MNSIADLLEPIQTTIEVLVARKNRPRSEQFAEGELARKLQKVFDEAAEQTLRRLAERQTVVSNDAVVRSILSPFDQAAGDLADETFEDAAQAMQRGRNKVIDTLRKQGMPLSFDEVSQTAISRVQESVFTASQRTMQRLVGDVKISLEQGIREGLGIADISKLLEEQFENMRGYELRRVARTETQHFQNIGAQEKMREIGVAYERWVTAGDDRVRESHVLVDGEITALDTPHSNGLRYPLDESGPIEEWVNCRCRAVPFLIPPDKAAPGPGPFYESDLIDVVDELSQEELQEELEKAQQEWATQSFDNITEDEQIAFMDYAEFGYEDINNAMRGFAEETSEALENIVQIRRAMERTPTTAPMTVHRATTQAAFGGAIDSGSVGKVFTEPAFMSTTASANIAEYMRTAGASVTGDWVDVMMTVNVPAGIPAAPLSLMGIGNVDEAEMLLGDGLRYLLTQATKFTNSRGEEAWDVVVDVLPKTG